MIEAPWLWFVAGPNGAGKSTYLEEHFAQVAEIIRPDEIATNLSPEAPHRAALRAGRETLRLMDASLKMRQSFAVETTLSGGLHLRLAERAKSDGWRIGLVYVGLASVDLAIERVRQRTLAGGHHVPAADVRRRYQRSLKNLATMRRMADEFLAFDNSSASARMKPVFKARRGRTVFCVRRLPGWLEPALPRVRARRAKKR
jgi:predicted ABC-type ATPase